MTLKNLLFTFLITIFAFNSQAQKTVVFNGKTYLVYPQVVDVGYYNSSPNIEINRNRIDVSEFKFPPIIGSITDGEYLLYTNKFYTVKKGKGKHATYDTLPEIYGTFNIKNNEKNGEAFIYSQYDLKKPNLKVNYKNDLIDGVIMIYAQTNYSDDDYNRLNYRKRYKGYKSNKKQKKLYSYAKVPFDKGLINGEILVYKVTNEDKDTVLAHKINMLNGVLHGKFIKNNYSFINKKAKPQIKSIETGEYSNGEKVGIWETSKLNYYTNTLTIDNQVIYKEGVIFEKINFSTKNDNKTNYAWKRITHSKDSVLFYYPEYKTEKTMLYTSGYEFDSDDSFILITYNDARKNKHVFKAYGNVSEEYYKNKNSYYTEFDTLINGIKIRVENDKDFNKNKFIKLRVYSVVDTFTFNDKYKHHSTTLYKEYYDDKTNQFIRIKYYDAYKLFFFKDSLIPEIKEKTESKYFTQTTYYQKALNYTFTNVKYTHGKLKNCEIYHQVKGGKNNGSIIKYIKIPSHYDTIYMVDTLMRNGRYLYKHDALFSQNYSNLVYKNDDDDIINSVILEEQLYNYLEPLPIHHKTILMGKDKFKGKINLTIDYDKKPKKFNVGVFEYKENILDIFEKKLSIDIAIERNENMLKGNSRSDFIMPAISKELYCDNGILDGNIEIKDYYKNTTNVYCFNNKIQGTFTANTYKFKSNYKMRYYGGTPDFFTDCGYHGPSYTFITSENAVPIKGSVLRYTNGIKEGQSITYSEGRISEMYNFQKEQQNGLQLQFGNYEDNYLSYVYTMQNDTVNGKVYKLYETGMPEITGNFKQGVPHGYFTAYNMDADTSKYFKQRYQFDNGFLTGNYLEYRDSNNLKVKISFSKQDSLIFDHNGNHYNPYSQSKFNRFSKHFDEDYLLNEYLNNSNSFHYSDFEAITGSLFVNSFFEEKTFKKAYYQYYYTSGYLFKQGYKAYDQPIGEWKVYREGNNRLYKTIQFKDSTLFANTPDSLPTYGLVKAYYDNGKPMFTGYATDFNFKYSCESDADMPTENDFYLNFYDTLGKPMLTNGNGFITELQANNNKLKEGKIVNNKKEGIWVYYSKFGLPDEIGNYNNGLKTGRWLVGDLGGLNLDEKICFMTDDEFKNWVKAFGGNLNLKEEFYQNGELVSTNYVNTIKR